MSKGNIKVVLEKRANDILEREKQVAEEAKEQERVRLLQAQKQEQERIDLEKMRKDNESLAQREKPVEPVVKEKPIETEVVENEGFILNFEGTIENAKNVARYAKEVVGATGVTLRSNLILSCSFACSATCFSLSIISFALFSSTTFIFSLLIDNKFSSS
jgi:hypothetical protein